MKKILLSLALVLLLVGCSQTTSSSFNKLTPQQQYQYVVEKLDNANSMDTSTTTSLTVIDNGTAYVKRITMDIKTVDERELKDAKAAVTMKIDGVQEQQHIYINDGYIYMDALGMKVKSEIMDEETVEQYTDMLEVEEFDPSVINNINTKVDGIDFIIHYTVNIDEVDEVLEQFDAIKEELPNADMSVSDVIGSFTVDKEGNIKKNNITLNAKLSMEGQSLELIMETITTYNQLGNVNIQFPEDLDTYVQY